MRRLAALRALPRRDRLRLAEAAVATLALDVCLRLFPPRRCFALVSARGPGRPDPRLDPERLAALAEIADRHLPGRAGCLRRALVLAWMLGRRGVATRIWIEVARDGRLLRAHAWLETAAGNFGAVEGAGFAWIPLAALPPGAPGGA